MLGWEFPPFFAGGAGIVCSELSKALNNLGVEVTFVMPNGPEKEIEELNSKKGLLKIKTTSSLGKKIKVKTVDTILTPYIGWEEYSSKYELLKRKNQQNPYGSNLQEEVERFAELIEELVKDEEYDVIHAHDWVTFLAAAKLKQKTGKPLTIHVHITEFDKSGGNYASPYIYGLEKLGMDEADTIIAVSNKVRERVIHNYYQNPNKIRVVHNAATPMNDMIYEGKELKGDNKMVLFAGRITLQKGPEYFVEAARLVLQKNPKVKFVIAGTGDLLPKIMDDVENKGLRSNFVFTGFYTRDEAEKIFSMADVFVMPSVSEPFGVVPFEAQIKKTPTIISKQSGIAEILKHALKVDFWDTREMANKILSLLEYSELHGEIQENGYLEAKAATWEEPAKKCIKIYEELI